MSLEIISYTPSYEDAWDAFCLTAINATFLHTRKFLSYHKDRFKDLSVLFLDSGKIVGVFPAAESPSDAALVISHPGITYGGILHAGSLKGEQMIDALSTLSNYYSNGGYRRLQYKAIPYTYTNIPAQDDLYALFRLGAQQTRCDLSCAIDLSSPYSLSKRRQRGLKKASDIVVLSGNVALLSELWLVIEENLARKFGATPVHSLSEIMTLIESFPGHIIIRCALIQGCVESGVIFFNSNNVWHAQYIASSSVGYKMNALDAVFISAIKEARSLGVKYFDFGTSNEDQGKILNLGLYTFKSEFGAGGVAHEFYELDLP